MIRQSAATSAGRERERQRKRTMTKDTTSGKGRRLLASASGAAFLPLVHDMLAMEVPENTAMRWHDAIWLLKSHAEHMAEVIEEQIGDKAVLREAAENFREAMCAIRPNDQAERPPTQPL